jgi:hypothetical protein
VGASREGERVSGRVGLTREVETLERPENSYRPIVQHYGAMGPGAGEGRCSACVELSSRPGDGVTVAELTWGSPCGMIMATYVGWNSSADGLSAGRPSPGKNLRCSIREVKELFRPLLPHFARAPRTTSLQVGCASLHHRAKRSSTVVNGCMCVERGCRRVGVCVWRERATVQNNRQNRLPQPLSTSS